MRCNCNCILLLSYLSEKSVRGVHSPPPAIFNLSFLVLRNSAFYPFMCLHWEFCLTSNKERIFSWELFICIKARPPEVSIHGKEEVIMNWRLDCQLTYSGFSENSKAGLIPSFFYYVIYVSFIIGMYLIWILSN